MCYQRQNGNAKDRKSRGTEKLICERDVKVRDRESQYNDNKALIIVIIIRRHDMY